MNERVRKIRRLLDLSQETFGGRLGVTKATISSIESGRRGLTERMVNDICREFGVNYEWLKNGTGDTFGETSNDLMDQVVREYGLDELDRRILTGYLKLSARDRVAVKKYIKSVVNKQGVTDGEK